MKNKKVLLVGTSFSAVPLLLDLKEKGYFISVCGGLKNDPCHSYCDQSFFIDYSQKEQLLDLCIKEKFDYLIPTCNDYSYNSCSYVATKLNKYFGFDSYETTMLLHTKNSFRKFTLENKLSAPNAVKYNDDLDLQNLGLDYPVLVKPDYSFSGKGITKVYNLKELDKAISYAKENSRNGNLVLEEFVEGELYSHSAFIQDGEIFIDFFVNEYCTVYPYQVDYSYLSYDLDDNIKEEVRENINVLVKKLNLVDGLLHTQFISDNNKFWLIETMRRCPGDLYGTLIKESANFKYSSSYIDYFLNEVIDSKIVSDNLKYIIRHTVSSSEKKIFLYLDENINANRKKYYPLKESGQILDAAPNDKVGIIFIEVEKSQQLLEYKTKVKNLIDIKGIKIV